MALKSLQNVSRMLLTNRQHVFFNAIYYCLKCAFRLKYLLKPIRYLLQSPIRLTCYLDILTWQTSHWLFWLTGKRNTEWQGWQKTCSYRHGHTLQLLRPIVTLSSRVNTIKTQIKHTHTISRQLNFGIHIPISSTMNVLLVHQIIYMPLINTYSLLDPIGSQCTREILSLLVCFFLYFLWLTYLSRIHDFPSTTLLIPSEPKWNQVNPSKPR